MVWKKLRVIVLGLLALYFALCVVARVTYPKALYPAPKRSHEIELRSGREGWEALALGEAPARALRKRAPRGHATIVWFHGNGELVDGLLPLGEDLVARGFGFAMLEYRGYGRSAAQPTSEDGLYADAEALLKALHDEKTVAGGELVLVGYSLGSAVAAQMAFAGLGDKLVLVAPFSSMRAMGKRLAPMLPIDLLMTERYDTLSKAPYIRHETLVIHGAQDELVPFAMGEAVSHAIPRSTLLAIPGGHHADVLWVSSEAAVRAIADFASGLPSHTTPR